MGYESVQGKVIRVVLQNGKEFRVLCLVDGKRELRFLDEGTGHLIIVVKSFIDYVEVFEDD